MYVYEAKETNYLNNFINLCICLPPIIYLRTVYKYALNIPFYDDYDATLVFLINFKKATFNEKISLLFLQQGEHRAIIAKAITALHYLIYNNINFRHLIFFSSFFLLVFFIVFIYILKKSLSNHWNIAALILSLGIFDLNNSENAIFSSSGMFNYLIIMIFISSILFYSFKNKKYIIPAALLQLACIYSGGNGLIGAFFILLFTILNRENKKIIVSALIFLIFSPLYFYHYNFSNPNSNFFTLNLSKVIPFFLNAIGANFGKYGFIAGIILLLSLITSLLINYKSKFDICKKALLCIAGFMLTSLSVMSVFRGNLPVDWAYAPRYLIYSHVLIAFIFIFIFFKFRDSNTIYFISIIFSVMLYTHGYRNGKFAFETIYATEKKSDYAYPINGKEHAKQVAEEACKENIYCIEQHRND